MAEREHLKCPACGSRRLLGAFGIDERGNYDPEAAPVHLAEFSIQSIGGRGRCAWTHVPLPYEFAQALHTRLEAALQQLADEIIAAQSQ